MIEFTFRPLTKFPRPLNRSPKRSQFSTTWAKTSQLLRSELEKLRAKQVVIEADCDEKEIRRDGFLRSDARLRTGAIVLSFDSPKGSLRFPCDTYRDWQDNIRAIALSLEALRAVDRYGVTSSAEQYTGWRKLTGPSDEPRTVEDAAAVVCQMAGGSPNVVMSGRHAWEAVYRRGCVDLHPDRNNGSDAPFKRFLQAAEILNRHFGI